MKEITTQTLVSKILEEYPEAGVILARHGMACEGCEAAPFETLEEAAAAYGEDAELILRELKAESLPKIHKTKGRKRK